MFPSILLFAPYGGQFSSSLLVVVDIKYLLCGLLFLPGELLLEQEAAKSQSMLETRVEGFRWSHTKKWGMQCMVLG